jgi:hypothetical protein
VTVRGAIRFVAIVAVVLISGCGSDPYGVGQCVPVRGQVLVNGQPLRLPAGAFGRVWFYPDVSRGNTCPQVPSGDLDAEGRFELAVRGRKGAPPGWYRVMVVASEQADPNHPTRKRKSFVHPRYASVDTSGLLLQVVAAPAAEEYNLHLMK